MTDAELTGYILLFVGAGYFFVRMWIAARREQAEDDAMARDWQSGFGDEG